MASFVLQICVFLSTSGQPFFDHYFCFVLFFRLTETIETYFFWHSLQRVAALPGIKNGQYPTSICFIWNVLQSWSLFLSFDGILIFWPCSIMQIYTHRHIHTSGSKTVSYRNLSFHLVIMWNCEEKPIGSWDIEEIQNQDPGISNMENIFRKKKYVSLSPQFLTITFCFRINLRDKTAVIFTVNNDTS